MNSLELLKQLRTIAYQNGDDMSLRTAKGILEFLINSNLIDKNPQSYGDLLIKVGTPKVK